MTALPPGSTIGILGGGQLGRMLAMAAAQLGYEIAVFAPEENSVAGEVAARQIVSGWDREAMLDMFARGVDVSTSEWENVPLRCIERIGAAGVAHFPPARCFAVAQDRIAEKGFAASLGLAVPAHAGVTDAASLDAAVAAVGTPAILKTAREGYDGKGQARVNSATDAAAAWSAIGEQRAILEAQIEFLGEFSVIVVRGQDGEVRHWDVPQNTHTNGILSESRVPASAAWDDQIVAATQQAHDLATALDYVGVMTVEFFATANGPVFNEIAPRVHNSGHWTIEGAVTSQFENHIRAICGLPLGDTATRATPVVMRNLIGDDANGWAALLADPACKLHLYGKGSPRAGRKMGHATWVGTMPQ